MEENKMEEKFELNGKEYVITPWQLHNNKWIGVFKITGDDGFYHLIDETKEKGKVFKGGQAAYVLMFDTSEEAVKATNESIMNSKIQTKCGIQMIIDETQSFLDKIDAEKESIQEEQLISHNGPTFNPNVVHRQF
jgi:hypothetical protein